jgi:hypothetical protein
MVIQSLEGPPIQVFVVKGSDVNIFESLDDLDCFLSPKPTATACQEASSLNCVGLPLVFSPYSSRNPSRRSSMGSSNSSNSSVCSKSINFGDESFVPFSEQSHFSSGTARRRGSGFSEQSHFSSGTARRRGSGFSEQSHFSSGIARRRGSGSRISSRRRRLKKERHVEFNPRIKVRNIPHVQDASEDELTERWYQKDELADIKQAAAETLRRAKAKEVPNDGEELRGLRMSKKQQRRSLWIMALTCVLDEQKRQARDKVHDPETMAKLYRSFAFSSEQIAQDLGRQDAEAAREIHS